MASGAYAIGITRERLDVVWDWVGISGDKWSSAMWVQP